MNDVFLSYINSLGPITLKIYIFFLLSFMFYVSEEHYEEKFAFLDSFYLQVQTFELHTHQRVHVRLVLLLFELLTRHWIFQPMHLHRLQVLVASSS
jgi:hypothetical protein